MIFVDVLLIIPFFVYLFSKMGELTIPDHSWEEERMVLITVTILMVLGVISILHG